MPTREQMIRELMIKDLEEDDAKKASDTSKDSWLRTKVPLIGTDLGESIVRPTLQGLGAVGGVIAGAPAGPLGSIAGAGAGYAGAEQLYKAIGGAPVGSLSEELGSTAKNVIEGATMEAGGQVIPAAFSAIRKTPQLVKSGINALRAEAPATGQGVIREVRTGGDVLKELSQVKPTPETIAANERFKAMGLEELTPAQLQSKIKGEPTPAQTAEAMIKAKDQQLYEQGQKQITSAENILNKYRELGSSSKEVAGQQIKEGLKKATKPYGEQIGKFKEAGADVGLVDKAVDLLKGSGFEEKNPSKDFLLKKYAERFPSGRYNYYKNGKSVTKEEDAALKDLLSIYRQRRDFLIKRTKDPKYGLISEKAKTTKYGTYYSELNGEKVRISNHPKAEVGYSTGSDYEKGKLLNLEEDYIKDNIKGIDFYRNEDYSDFVFPGKGGHLNKFKKIENDLIEKASKENPTTENVIRDIVNKQEITKKPIPPMSKLPEEGQFPAIKTDDGSIFFEPNNGIHLDIIEKQGIPPERIKSGGFLKDGVYEPSSRSSTEALAEQARAKERISIKRKQFTKPKLPISNQDEFSLIEDFSKVKKIEALYNRASTIKDLDNISSNLGTQMRDPYINGNYKNKLREIKNVIEETIASKLESKGFEKPKEAYTVYAQVKQLEDDVLKGINKVGGAKTVINRVTSSNESIDKFRKTAQALQAPELMTTVKENWLADLLSDPKFKSKWEKVKREGIAQNLLEPEQFKKLDIVISEYLPKAESTLAKTVNPSRTGMVEGVRDFAKRPKEFIVEFIIGDERKYSKAISRYKKVLASRPGLDNGEASNASKSARRALPYILGREEDK